jgi:hypothetical protein
MSVTIEGGTVFKLDRNESAFFSRELESIKTRTYDAKYKELKAFSYIPISTTAGSGVSQITFRRFTGVGFAKIIADYGKDFSRVDVYGEEDSVKVVPIGVSYGYNIKEIRESIRSGKNLDARRAATARRAADQKINELALFSDPKAGTRGVIDYPGITEQTLPADGTGGSKSWKTKTVDQVLRDINIITDGIMIPTNGVEVPDTLLVPLEIYNFLANTRLGDNVTTLLKYIIDNNPHIKKIDWLTELAHAGAGGTGRILCGKFDEEHLTLEIPQAFEQFDPELKGMEYTVACHCETAGVIVYYPMAFCFADGA